MDSTETVGYEDRDGMARDVERRSDEGWVVRRITSLPGGACEVEYERRGGDTARVAWPDYGHESAAGGE